MTPAPPIPFDQGALADFCGRWSVWRLEVFGSGARGELRPESDVDLLVSFAPGARWGLFDHMTMREELEVIMGRKVDLATRRSIEASPNWIRREAILGEARLLYGS